MKRSTWQYGIGTIGAALLVILVTVAPAAQDETTGPVKVKVGQKAPDFTLPDLNDQKRKLSDLKGKIVVLEWTDFACSIIQMQHYNTKQMERAYRKVKELDKAVEWLAINSTPGTTAQKNKFGVQQHGIKYPVLLDPDSKVGRQYDVGFTPHMVVIDRKGIVRYMGAIDDNRLGNKTRDTITNYVVKAVEQILTGATVSPNTTKAYGCVVKFRR